MKFTLLHSHFASLADQLKKALVTYTESGGQAALNKQSSTNRKTPEQIDAAIRQLVSKAITTEGQVIDLFTAAGF
ncbi:MAG: hypothetical protein EXS30_10145 [Pedosphaera sp.]|nr:hypothetical protein [Pedosphaera sp.]